MENVQNEKSTIINQSKRQGFKRAIAFMLTMVMIVGVPTVTFAKSTLNLENYVESYVLYKTVNGDNHAKTVSEGDEISFNDNLMLRCNLIVNEASSGDTIYGDAVYTVSMPSGGALKIPDGIADQTIFVDNNGAKTTMGAIVINSGVATFTLDSDFKAAGNDYTNVYIEMSCQLDSAALGQNPSGKIELSKSETISVNIKENKPHDPVLKSKTGKYDKNTGKILWTLNIEPPMPYASGTAMIIEDNLGKDQTYVTDSAVSLSTSCQAIAVGNTLTVTTPAITTDTVIKYETKPNNALFYQVSGGTYTIKNAENIKITNSAQLKNLSGGAVGKAVSDTVLVDMEPWITKDGTYHPKDRKISWEIKVDTNDFNFSQLTLFDEITAMELELDKGSVKISSGGVETQVNSSDITENFDKEDGTAKTKGMSFDITLKNGVSKYVITYDTKVKDELYDGKNKDAWPRNTVWLKYHWDPGDGIGEKIFGVPSVFKNIKIPFSLIEKSGKYDASTGIIMWNVIVNKNKAGLSDVKVADIVGPNQEYITKSAVYTTDDWKTSGSALKVVIGESGDTVKFDLGDIGTTTVAFTLKTKATDGAFYANNAVYKFKNKVNLESKIKGNLVTASAVAQPTFKSVILEKECTGYDYSSNQLSWKVTVNRNGLDITTAAIVDTIPIGQSYVDGSLLAIVTGSSGRVEQGATTHSISVTYGGIKTVQTFTYDTRLEVDDSTYSGNFTSSTGAIEVKNDVRLDSDYYKGVKVTTTKPIENKLLVKGVTYNQSDYTFKYIVGINANRATLNDCKLTDTISPYLMFDLDTVKLYEAKVNKNGTLNGVTEVAISTGSTKGWDMNVQKTGALTITLPDTNSAYVLKYDAYISPSAPPGNQDFWNKIEMGLGGAPDPVETHKNQLVLAAGGGGMRAPTKSILEVRNLDCKTKVTITSPGAVFELWTTTAGVASPYKLIDMPASGGSVVFTNLTPGKEYLIVQTAATIGYSVGQTKTVTAAAAKATVNVDICNKANVGTINFEKVDNYKNPVVGAIFGIYNIKDTGFKTPVATASSIGGGKVYFRDVAQGSFNIKEISAPANYTVNKGVFKVSVGSNGNTSPITNASGTAVQEIVNVYTAPPSGGGGQFPTTTPGGITNPAIITPGGTTVPAITTNPAVTSSGVIGSIGTPSGINGSQMGSWQSQYGNVPKTGVEHKTEMILVGLMILSIVGMAITWNKRRKSE